MSVTAAADSWARAVSDWRLPTVWWDVAQRVA